MLHVNLDFLVVGVLDRVEQDKLELEVEIDLLVFQDFPNLLDH